MRKLVNFDSIEIIFILLKILCNKTEIAKFVNLEL